MFEKNIYVKQSEIKASYKQDKNIGFLVGELTINSTLKNYQAVLDEAFEISMNKIQELNENLPEIKTETKDESKGESKKKKDSPPKTPKKETKNVKGMN